MYKIYFLNNVTGINRHPRFIDSIYTETLNIYPFLFLIAFIWKTVMYIVRLYRCHVSSQTSEEHHFRFRQGKRYRLLNGTRPFGFQGVEGL
jgi:hypothetical protein